MIYEYFVDPEVLAEWAKNERDYAEFLREYGLGTPRILSSFPKAKVSKLRGYLFQAGPQNKTTAQGRRYEEMIISITNSIIIRDVTNVNEDDLEQSILRAHQEIPFSVIISNKDMTAQNCITTNNMYNQGSVWIHAKQASISRTTQKITSMLSNIFRLATQQVVIVDTFGWTPEAINTIGSILNCITQNRVNDNLPSVFLFYKEKRGGNNTGNGSPNAIHVREQIIAKVVEKKLQLTVFELNEVGGGDVFHNRCILTEHGGILTGHGFGLTEQEEHTDEWCLMESEIYKKKWQQFIGNNLFSVASQST